MEFNYDAAFLDEANIEAAYVVTESGGPGTIYLRPEPSRAAVIEELKHMGQHRAAGFPGEQVWGMTRRTREMTTQIQLANSRTVGWTKDEWSSFIRAWNAWRTGAQ